MLVDLSRLKPLLRISRMLVDLSRLKPLLHSTVVVGAALAAICLSVHHLIMTTPGSCWDIDSSEIKRSKAGHFDESMSQQLPGKKIPGLAGENQGEKDLDAKRINAILTS